jgi:hypothetical protein
VAPNSRLLPIVISRVDRAAGAHLDHCGRHRRGGRGRAEVINISAKWPVDSRAISESIVAAVGGRRTRRLLVTGYATSLDGDDTSASTSLPIPLPARGRRGSAHRHAWP